MAVTAAGATATAKAAGAERVARAAWADTTQAEAVPVETITPATAAGGEVAARTLTTTT